MQQQKLCLKWNNHTVNLLTVLENFQARETLVDVTLSCEGRNIKAHKMVLSACSPYFQNIFLENPCQHPIVIINGMKFEDITSILNFMYKGEVNISHEGLSSFLQAAEALKVKGLAEVCGERRGANSSSQEAEPSEPVRPQRTDTPNKKRHRNRKRSFSDSNRSDDEGAPRKHKEINSPEVHELSGDESFTGDMSSNGQPLNSRVPQNVYSRSHQSSSNITPDDMEDDYEVEPSKMLEQTLTENANNSTSSDNGLRIERIVGNAPEMESSSLQEPESPPDIKPIIEYGESSAGPSEGNMLVYNEQSQPGPSNIQDASLLHDNSHTQETAHKLATEASHKVMQDVLKDSSSAFLHDSPSAASPTAIPKSSRNMVELVRGCGVFIRKTDRHLILAASMMDPRVTRMKADEWEKKNEEFSRDPLPKKRLFCLPPLRKKCGDIYLGPYDPCKIIKNLLRILFSIEKLSCMSGSGRKAISSGNIGVPSNILNAILAFVKQNCPELILPLKHVNAALNEACCYARRVVKRETIRKNYKVKQTGNI